ncbi:MAG: sugar fermentation stimulation protein SfsA [Thermobacillus sp. ZCTH02-B1]|uniref:DNA/RNA nuclease SfsA n=1 Tax=Thermobacillus sp. ZCTH02-B1 TaxID=1858795 RepID=UPI000B54AF3A|nr:DNA/RNA nuclease SfsA [Thermobacillus sp. ZCTH02-B1]OUM95779.1 MAG: sugar fermentation stimulation protein SfsA [Thermobacillus sp. ZCTH02-B1]
MRYGKVREGVFIRRLNRFVAEAEIDGRVEKVHVKNTGRLQDWLVPGNTVVLEDAGSAGRKTRYSLIAARRGQGWVNIDSQAPNAVVREALLAGRIGEPGSVRSLRGEAVFGGSRFDFHYVDDDGREGFIEVKGVTLERDGTALFPDAPTLRGARHLEELAKAAESGYAAFAIFLVQMEGCRRFKPHGELDPRFAEALRRAARAGVRVLAYESVVSPDEIVIGGPIEVTGLL